MGAVATKWHCGSLNQGNEIDLIFEHPDVDVYGLMKSKKRQIITPVIVFKRNTININETIPQDKLDANNPHLFYPFQKKYSQVNRYDNLTTQIGTVSQREYYNVSFPDYVTLTYDFIIWTSFIKQMNKIVERINYSDGAYWGDPEKMRFRSIIDSFDDATEIGDTERLIRTNFNLKRFSKVLFAFIALLLCSVSSSVNKI